MARKPADTAGAARAGADTAPLPEGVTEDTLVVKGEAATAAPEAAPEPGTTSRLPEGVTEENVVVGGEAADPMPEVGTADAPSTAPPLPGDATDDAPITGIAARYAGPIPLSAPASAWETPPAESVRPNAT